MQKHFNNIYELVDFVKKNYEYGKYIFRGQSRNWELKSSLFRIGDNDTRKKEFEKTLYFYDWLLRNSYLKSLHEPNEQLFAIAQHHGFKTDLLDFTFDIEVAAFFASNDYNKEGNDNIDISKKGVIWAIKLDEFDFYINKEANRGTNGYVNENLFKNYNIKGLWRLENQKGVFVRDAGGCFSHIVGNTPDFTFTHIKDRPYLSDKINKDYIYPEANNLEREINRFTYFINIIEGRKFINEKMIQYGIQPVTIHLPDINNPELISEIKSYDWNQHEWLEINQMQYKNIISDENIHKIFIDSMKEDELTERFLEISKYAKKLQNGKKIIPSIKVEIIDKDNHINNIEELEILISNAIFTMIQYPYKDTDIAIALTFLTKYYYEKNKPENIYKNPIDIAKLVYDSDNVFELSVEDTLSVCTRFYINKDFFDNIESMTKIRENINLKDSDINLSHNFDVLCFTSKPEKLFSFDNALEIWSKYIFPYQFIYRDESSRIYAPVNISAIGLP